MGVPEKYTYYWTIFSGFPFGIGSFIAGIYLFITISPNPVGLERFGGVIKNYGVKEVIEKSEAYPDTKRELFYVEIQTDKEFYSDLGKHKDLLVKYFNGKDLIENSVTVWTEKNEMYIEQLSVNGKVILKYKPPYWMAWTFLIMGILVTVGAILYLRKYSADIAQEKGFLRKFLSGKNKGSE
ncbi:hypothetical protein L21SP5_00108 [Salinivirga cyanobacteriivorans]|uniref:Uncharacterized protein n=1 Tax=Salinivirga cyanobacteriivorans TaxID=1307839 RepID=A0A0S2HUP7_9BACT|nr:hypothetical protein [Salinivirga cyanobacteriivorans]ALO13777.1 hypothetical protein L21SP5_00095 [Salinivirga cyanobacteriivorans]ALO13790.1 hypothetical protein L21SP5_00108 [Salinivirga cyanobacteriivorans]